MDGEVWGTCPYCGSIHVTPIWMLPDLRGVLTFHACCPDCGARGPRAKDFQGAMEAWEILCLGGLKVKEEKYREIPLRNPDHLCGTDAIAQTFGVSRSAVTKWKEMGAPILRIGNKHQANYPELWKWLLLNLAET